MEPSTSVLRAPSFETFFGGTGGGGRLFLLPTVDRRMPLLPSPLDLEVVSLTGGVGVEMVAADDEGWMRKSVRRRTLPLTLINPLALSSFTGVGGEVKIAADDDDD